MNAPAIVADPPPFVNIARLRNFVGDVAELLATNRDEQIIAGQGGALLARLIACDDWLPARFTVPDPERYQQYLLHCDARERFSVVAFVWGPGQATPIHDHRVWGLVGVLRGEERVEKFRRLADGSLRADGPPARLLAGEVDTLSPTCGDIHRVTNGLSDRTSMSIHVYGGNISAVERATYDLDGREKRFISGYANDVLPNLWDRSRPV